MANLNPRDALRHAIAYEHRLFQEVHKHEQLVARWQQRAELAFRRGEQALATEALDRIAKERQIVQDYESLYRAQSNAVRRAKQGVVRPPIAAPRSERSIEDRLEQLTMNERLERDLAALKARLGAG